MINNGIIITQIGTKQNLFKDRETYPKQLCDYIEDIISCNISKFSDENNLGRIRFSDSTGKLVTQLTIDDGKSFLVDEKKCIILIRGINGKVKSSVYYGVDCSVDFISTSIKYSLDSVDEYVDSLKNFYSSWSIGKGEVGAVILIIDDYNVFEKIVSDGFFKGSYILYSE